MSLLNNKLREVLEAMESGIHHDYAHAASMIRIELERLLMIEEESFKLEEDKEAVVSVYSEIMGLIDRRKEGSETAEEIRSHVEQADALASELSRIDEMN